MFLEMLKSMADNELAELTQKLGSPNRVRISDRDKATLRAGQSYKMKVRQDRTEARRKEYMK